MQGMAAAMRQESTTVERLRHIGPGDPLTEAERATLAAFVAERGLLKGVAHRLGIHINTVKYRTACIRAKLGTPEASQTDLLVLAVRAGLDDPEDRLRAFVLWASSRAEGEGDYFGPALGAWLRAALSRWERAQVAG